MCTYKNLFQAKACKQGHKMFHVKQLPELQLSKMNTSSLGSWLDERWYVERGGN